MGANQSSTNSDPSGGGEVRTSYYELLGVERTASEDEIKKAYRKKALELHPDRNYGDVDRATSLFAEVQTAYEVLSDPQERAWYDSHEGQILRGGDASGEDHYENNVRVTTADDIARMLSNFHGKIDYSDSPSGFFGFLRETFEKLAKEEEVAASIQDIDLEDYPSFGHMDDTYEDVVRSFYSVWNGFGTKKTFAWKDKYRLSDAPDRRIRRLMEKENQKSRDEAKREFNQAVQTLVAFVRKRDPRYTPNLQSEEDRTKAQRASAAAQAARMRAANAAKAQDAVPEWATRRDEEEEIEEEDEESEEEVFECVACHKTFKSEQQYDAHEKSKKHQKAVQALKRKMQKENRNLHLDDDVTTNGAITPVDEEGDEDGDQDEFNDPVESMTEHVKDIKVNDSEGDIDTDVEERSNDDNAQSDAEPSTALSSHSSDEDDEYASRSEVEERLAGFKTFTEPSTVDDFIPDPEEISSKSTPAAPKMGKAAQKRAKKAAKQAEVDQADQSDSKFSCAGCSAGFPSKTQLFQHLKDHPKHAALKSVAGGKAGKKGKKR